jgi:activating signal cointegrator 1
MKALSLWQPHATAIALGLKPWETRGWATSYRGPLAIHAAKRAWDDVGPWHREARQKMQRYVEQHGAVPWAFGAVVCIVDLVECLRTSTLRGAIPREHEFWGDFSEGENGAGRYAFRLGNVRVLPRAVAWRGQQGFFDVELGAWEVHGHAGTMSLFPADEDLPSESTVFGEVR